MQVVAVVALVLGLVVQEAQAEVVLVVVALMEMDRMDWIIPEEEEAVLLTSQVVAFMLVALVVPA